MFLQFAFKEANTANAKAAAKAALEQLHNLLMKQAQISDQCAPAVATAAAVETAVLDCTLGTDSRSSSATQITQNTATPAIAEGVVLRVWVKLLLGELTQRIDSVAAARKADEAAAAAGDADPAHQQQQEGAIAAAVAAACQSLAQFSEVLSRVSMRVRKLGLEVFTGEKEGAAVQQLDWFSTCAWNAGLHAVGKPACTGCDE